VYIIDYSYCVPVVSWTQPVLKQAGEALKITVKSFIKEEKIEFI